MCCETRRSRGRPTRRAKVSRGKRRGEKRVTKGRARERLAGCCTSRSPGARSSIVSTRGSRALRGRRTSGPLAVGAVGAARCPPEPRLSPRARQAGIWPFVASSWRLCFVRSRQSSPRWRTSCRRARCWRSSPIPRASSCSRAAGAISTLTRRACGWRRAPARREGARGTNAIGTAIVERRPVAVIGAAHYEERNRGLFCYAMPIHDPYGRLVAVLDVTGAAENSTAPLSQSPCKRPGWRWRGRSRCANTRRRPRAGTPWWSACCSGRRLPRSSCSRVEASWR